MLLGLSESKQRSWEREGTCFDCFSIVVVIFIIETFIFIVMGIENARTGKVNVVCIVSTEIGERCEEMRHFIELH